MRVLLLQHPEEALHAKSSARLLRLSLLECHCAVGEVWAAQALADVLRHNAVLLYPAASGAAAAEAAAPLPEEVGCVVVLDGTWRQSRQVLHRNPWLLTLPRLPLQNPPPSRYSIRKAQRPEHQRSTLEATCLALGTLENRPAHYEPLLQGFADWVQAEEHSRLRA